MRAIAIAWLGSLALIAAAIYVSYARQLPSVEMIAAADDGGIA